MFDNPFIESRKFHDWTEGKACRVFSYAFEVAVRGMI
jgi:hypothetical protein